MQGSLLGGKSSRHEKGIPRWHLSATEPLCCTVTGWVGEREDNREENLFFKCGPWSSRLGVSLEFVTDTKSQTPTQIYSVRICTEQGPQGFLYTLKFEKH